MINKPFYDITLLVWMLAWLNESKQVEFFNGKRQKHIRLCCHVNIVLITIYTKTIFGMFRYGHSACVHTCMMVLVCLEVAEQGSYESLKDSKAIYRRRWTVCTFLHRNSKANLLGWSRAGNYYFFFVPFPCEKRRSSTVHTFMSLANYD